jgi:hypothetical protein
MGSATRAALVRKELDRLDAPAQRAPGGVPPVIVARPVRCRRIGVLASRWDLEMRPKECQLTSGTGTFRCSRGAASARPGRAPPGHRPGGRERRADARPPGPQRYPVSDLAGAGAVRIGQAPSTPSCNAAHGPHLDRNGNAPPARRSGSSQPTIRSITTFTSADHVAAADNTFGCSSCRKIPIAPR